MSWWSREETKICSPELLFEQLEDRIVLDVSTDPFHSNFPVGGPTDYHSWLPADAAVAPDQAGNLDLSVKGATLQPLQVILVSDALPDVDLIVEAASDSADIILYDAKADNFTTINTMLDDLVSESGTKIGAVAFLDHGGSAEIVMGTDHITMKTFQTYVPNFLVLASELTDNAQIQFFGCNVAKDFQGKVLVDMIAAATNSQVYASSDTTGGGSNNWGLEYTSRPPRTRSG